MFVLVSTLAAAQQPAQPAAPDQPGVLSSISHWFHQQAGNITATFRGAGQSFENFGHKAGAVASTTVDNAKDAADAVARIPGARMISGHETCKIAPNGAPDCVSAANTICKANGFASGKSIDMTTAEVCPAEVYLAGHTSGPNCHTETFVSRALCQ